ncbi:MAG: hypothetical protein DPW16_04970 [Chloroflexi bacterium]|nr:hypothetical protein [Chloroflexota bacterium]
MNGMVLLKQSQKIMAALTLVLLTIWGMGLSYANNSPQSLQQISGQTNYDEVSVLGRGSANSIAWSPDGASLIVAGSLGLWLYEDNFQVVTHLVSTSEEILLAAWSPDGTRIAGATNSNGIKIWDVATGLQLTTIASDTFDTFSLKWSPDSSKLATASYDQIRVWDSVSGQFLAALPEQVNSVSTLVWNPSGSQLAGAWDGTIYIWDTTTYEQMNTFSLQSGRFKSIDWSIANKIAVTNLNAQQILLLDGATGKLEQKFDGEVSQVAWSSDGNLLAGTANSDVQVWDAMNFYRKSTLIDHLGAVREIKWKPNSKVLAASSMDNNVRIWDTLIGQVMTHIDDHTSSVESVTWMSTESQIGAGYKSGEVRLWNFQINNLVNIIHLDGRTSTWNNDQTLLAGNTDSETLTVWNWADLLNDSLNQETSSELDIIYYKAVSFNDITAIGWSPDDQFLAISSNDYFARVIDAATGDVIFGIEHESQEVFQIIWSPDGQQVATAADNVRIWNARNGTSIATLPSISQTVWRITWSPDGQRIAGGSWEGCIVLWNATTHDIEFVTSGHADSITALAWHPRGNILASGSDDGTIILWDVNTGEVIETLTGHNGPVTALAWNSDGTQLASGGEDGTIRIWANE